MLRRLLDKILESAPYKRYMENSESTFAADCELWIQLFRNVIIESDELAEAMESMSVYWNDDLAIMGSFALKTIKAYAKRRRTSGATVAKIQRRGRPTFRTAPF